MSFKQKLENYLRQHKQATYDTLAQFATQHQTKIETLVRTCRLSKLIYPIKNTKGAIMAYRYNNGLETKIEGNKACCSSYALFDIHSRDCDSLVIKEKKGLF